MKRRIYGLETEFGIIWTPEVAHRKTLTVQNVVMYLFREIVAGRMYPDVFLENGARFYQDIGCHPEYATPECDDVAELVAHDKAGERIITRLASNAEQRMRNDGFYGKISIFKNNLDTPGNTYGCHENYLMERHVDFRQLASQLIPFFVTRQVFAGAGKIKPSDRGYYAISQRAEHIREEISIGTTTARGIINTRDEPHADREKYRRLHVIVGDSNMSEFSTFLKVGTTGIILRMIEDNFIQQRFALRNPVKAIREISDDVKCKHPIELQNGKRLSAVELQWQYLECAKRYLEQAESDATTTQIMARWEYVLTCLESDPMQLERELDWVIKWKWLQTYLTKRGFEWDAPQVKHLDLKYHNVRQEESLYYTSKTDRRSIGSLKMSRFDMLSTSRLNGPAPSSEVNSSRKSMKGRSYAGSIGVTSNFMNRTRSFTSRQIHLSQNLTKQVVLFIQSKTQEAFDATTEVCLLLWRR